MIRPYPVIRPYQQAAIDAARAMWRDPEADAQPLVVMATGTGKTYTALSLAADELDAGHRVVWLAHRQELVRQPVAALTRWWPHLALRVGVVQAANDEPHRDLVVASVATLAVDARLAALRRHGPIDLVIVDEAHHSTAASWARVLDGLGATRELGLTATADRADGGDLGARWEIAYSYGIADALADGYLVPPYATVVPLPGLDLTAVGGRRDYDDAELGAALLRAHVVDHTVAALAQTHLATRLPGRDHQRHIAAKGRSILVFTATIEQARLTAEALRGAGWRAEHLSGETHRAERAAVLRRFEAGDIEVVCNAAVLTEGTDLPRCKAIVLARPSRSWSLVTQMIGRGLRPYEAAEDCLVIDLAGATDVHDLRAAPVLIGGSPCPDAPNGVHDFEDQDDGRGRCIHCGRTIACFAGLGPHRYAQGKCVHCGRVQCPESPTLEHAWVPEEDYRRTCMYCGAETRDPLSGLRRVARRDDAPQAAWVRIGKVHPEVWAVDISPHGTLYAAGTREGDGDWDLLWVRRRGRKARRIAQGLPTDQVRPYADDLVRRSERGLAGGSWRSEVGDRAQRYQAWQATGRWPRWRATAGELADIVFRASARERALRLGICREAIWA